MNLSAVMVATPSDQGSMFTMMGGLITIIMPVRENTQASMSHLTSTSPSNTLPSSKVVMGEQYKILVSSEISNLGTAVL